MRWRPEKEWGFWFGNTSLDESLALPPLHDDSPNRYFFRCPDLLRAGDLALVLTP